MRNKQGVPKLVAALFTGSQRGMAMGIYVTGPAIGGGIRLRLTNSCLLPTLGSWRQVMLLWAGVALVAAVTSLALGRAFAIGPDTAPQQSTPRAVRRNGST